MLFLIAVFNSSCKKYTCECTASNNGVNGGYSDFYVKGTKSKAKKECQDHSIAVDSYGNKTDCEIK